MTAIDGIRPSDLDGEAFARDLEVLRPALVRRLTLIVGDRDEAEDVAQEACLRALRRQTDFDGRDLGAWLDVVGVRLALNELRRRKRWLAALGRHPTEPSVPSVEGELWASLQTVGPRERAALLMHVLDGYSYQEIARSMGVAEGTVGSWISRTKARIRADLARNAVNGGRDDA